MSDYAAAYRAGAEAGVLVLQKCGECALIRHYPQALCPACQSAAVGPAQSSGRGVVHSWTVTHHAFDPAFAADVPYVLATVDMAEGVRVLGRLRGEPATGLAVRITFAPGAGGAAVPLFLPA